MKKICVITGTRAEYGLLTPVMRTLDADPEFELSICVTGTHLSPAFGLTYKQIEADGFTISEKVEMLLSSDTKSGMAKSMGLGIIGFSDAFTRLQPDLLLVLGDRYELLAACSAALALNIPIAHCHGGETTEGAIDEAIRHAITKMSHLHFTSTETYRQRVIQMGEQPERVFHTGALGIENILHLPLLEKEALENAMGFKLGATNFLVTFHPVTLSNLDSRSQFRELTAALEAFPDAHIIFTRPNADPDNYPINTQIDAYVAAHPETSVAFDSLGQLRYLSAIPFMDAVIGNSSSGLIEVPSFHVPTVNIGDRQKGRISGETVLHCPTERSAILSSIQQALSSSFKQAIRNAVNPYGNVAASEIIRDVLKRTDLSALLHKTFHDLPVQQ